jgi:hypothetical protein
MRWPRANLEEKQEPRAATSASAKRHAEGMWHDVTRKALTKAAIEKPTFGLGLRGFMNHRAEGPACAELHHRAGTLLMLMKFL